MINDVEDAIVFVEQSGKRPDCNNPYNLALILYTQTTICDSSLLEIALSTLIATDQSNPHLFIGLIDVGDCFDVYRLGRMPTENIVEQLTERILELNVESLYFGGIHFSEGKVYLVADSVENSMRS